MGGPAKNADQELWRERPDDYYSPSIHVTAQGGIGINVAGTVYVRPVAEWHALAELDALLASEELPEGLSLVPDGGAYKDGTRGPIDYWYGAGVRSAWRWLRKQLREESGLA